MDKTGEIEIKVTGSKGNMDLSPDNFDIFEITSILQQMEDMLYPNNKKDRPIISYDIERGSIRNIFRTGIQAIIGFNAVLLQIDKSKTIDFLELKTAKAIEGIQELAYKKDYAFEVKTSLSESFSLNINANTRYLRTEHLWIDAEFYLYGMLTNAGGKSKANIHLDTEDFGSITIETPKEYLKEKEENLLYKKFGVRVVGKQNKDTGEMDRSNLKLIELINYDPEYDEEYLSSLVGKAKGKWTGVNADEFLSDFRGSYD